MTEINSSDLMELRNTVKQIQADMGKVVVGSERIVRFMFIALMSGNHILLEGVPGNIDTGALRSAIGAVPGVRESHDLHVWAITTGEVSLTAHVVLDATVADAESVLRTIRSRLSEDFGITHVTLQAESESCVEEGGRVHR